MGKLYHYSEERPFPGDIVTRNHPLVANQGHHFQASLSTTSEGGCSLRLFDAPSPDFGDRGYWSLVEPLSPVIKGRSEIRLTLEAVLATGRSPTDDELLSHAEIYWRPAKPGEASDYYVSKARVLIAFDSLSSTPHVPASGTRKPKAPAHGYTLPNIEGDLDLLYERLMYQEIVGAPGRRYLALPVERDGYDNKLFAVIPISARREKNLKNGNLSLRQAFLHSEGAVFMTRDFHDYSEWTERASGRYHVPRSRYRFGGPSRKQSAFIGVLIARKLGRWRF
jgi:hypothetical protein